MLSNSCGGNARPTPVRCDGGVLRPALAWHDQTLPWGSGRVLCLGGLMQVNSGPQRPDKRRNQQTGGLEWSSEEPSWAAGGGGDPPVSVPSAPWRSSRQPSGRGRGSGSSDQVHFHVLIHVCAGPVSHMQVKVQSSQSGAGTALLWPGRLLPCETPALVPVTHTGDLTTILSAGAAC